MIWNLTKKTVISKKPVAANSFVSRARGMIGKKFENFDAMIFYNCNSIHTMLMSIPLDVIFLNKSNKICEIRENLVPWKPFVRAEEAWAVIEWPVGTVKNSNTEKGDILDLNAQVSDPNKVFGKNTAVTNISPATVVTCEMEAFERK